MRSVTQFSCVVSCGLLEKWSTRFRLWPRLPANVTADQPVGMTGEYSCPGTSRPRPAAVPDVILLRMARSVPHRAGVVRAIGSLVVIATERQFADFAGDRAVVGSERHSDVPGIQVPPGIVEVQSLSC